MRARAKARRNLSLVRRSKEGFEKWLNLRLKEKKRTLPCFNAFGFDEEGRLYEKDYLGDRKWHFVKPDKVVKENED